MVNQKGVPPFGSPRQRNWKLPYQQQFGTEHGSDKRSTFLDEAMLVQQGHDEWKSVIMSLEPPASEKLRMTKSKTQRMRTQQNLRASGLKLRPLFRGVLEIRLVRIQDHLQIIRYRIRVHLGFSGLFALLPKPLQFKREFCLAR